MATTYEVVPDLTWMTLTEAASFCGLSVRSIRRIIQDGSLHPSRAGKRKLVLKVDEVQSYLENRDYTPLATRGGQQTPEESVMETTTNGRHT